MNVLHLDSSILADQSVSRTLTHEVVEALRLGEADLRVTYRDLALQAEPIADAALLAARATPADSRDAAQSTLVARADAVVAETLAADLIVIGAPMYNFGIPSQLKNWIDLNAVAGVTFRYAANGPEGLLGGRRAVIVATAGGRHAGQPSGAAHVDYLKVLLAFLGITDVSVVMAEGLKMGPEVRDAALGSARRAIAAAVQAPADAAA